MKIISILGSMFILLAVTAIFSDIPNIAAKQKRALLPAETIIIKADVKAAEEAVTANKYQFQINYDAGSVWHKLDWIRQNEANK